MFSWGEDCLRGFWLKGDGNRSATKNTSSDAGVHHVNISYRIIDLSASHNVLAFLKSNGNAFIVPTNEGKDGVRVRGKQKFVKYKEKIAAVNCGDDVVTLLSERGSVLCVDITHSPYIPRLVETLSNIPVSQVACGSQHSVALTKDGQVYTWGQNCRGQLGLGTTNSGSSSPQPIQSLSAIPLVRIAAGGEQSFALSVSGGVFGWGRNDCGQLGLGDTEDRHTPVSVHSLNLKQTCDISCGKDHTAILTKHGAVFTFGSGQYGQLGHNSLQNELRPRLVAELGAKVTKIACGRHHTLVLTDFNKIYSFGCQEQGQLGRKEENHPSVPLPVELPQDTSDPKIKSIFAGENCSFATCSSDEEVQRDSNTDSVNDIVQHCLEGVIDRWISECDSKSWKKIKQEIHRMFSSASCLNKSFLEQSGDKHFQTSPKYHGLNLKLARLTFKKMVKKDKVWEEVEAALLHLLPRLHKNPVGVEGLRIYLLLNELLHVIQKHTRQQNTELAEAVAAAVTDLSANNLQLIGDWWSSLSLSTMGRYVKVWKQAISVILSEPFPHYSGVRNLLQVLQYMYNVNSRAAESQRMPESNFYLLLDQMFLMSDLELWRFQSQHRFGPPKPLVLCDFPVVMDLQAKIQVFNMNAELSKLEATLVFSNFFFLLFGCPIPSHEELVLNLKHASVLEDTFDQLAAAHHKDYKKPLMICFDDYWESDNLPVYMKDFFYEVFHEIMSAESGLFMFNETETLAWFSSKAPKEDRRFYLFGVLCGLALYNNVIIYLPFPLVLFKKLLGVRPSLEDMMEFSPTDGNRLTYILDDHTDDDIEDLEMDFLINWNNCEVDLDPQNPEKRVTNHNKKEFVDAFVNHAFNTSVETVFQEFKRGFFQVCDRDLVRLFRPKELQKVLVGEDFQDWERLKQSTQYKGTYHVGHPNIQMFWEIFDELTENQKKAFLWFVTGFERLPIVNMGKIKMEIRDIFVEDVSNDIVYPQTHTCSSLLELPVYSCKEIMQVKLVEALKSNRRISQ
ncbi:probable E3 ubiquitin-protein ligase HERC4 [Melanotaenia boesemani]|uniref:probable E3 ubiquitin-protein ligase HERC4 n=1 Tax=Melanotaenia boesemani TaxID=1250792 RepID=UPI001C03A464|nr:probable E3 ubiquitin-protein ligase HERC4 [Melanotaenia boesemani]